MSSELVTIARKCFFSCGVTRSDCGNSGFNYVFEVYLKGPIDPVSGLVVNLTDVKKILLTIKDTLDQKHLNHDISPALTDYTLSHIHQYIHQLFLDEFKGENLNHIKFFKSKLFEGKTKSSEIIMS